MVETHLIACSYYQFNIEANNLILRHITASTTQVIIYTLTNRFSSGVPTLYKVGEAQRFPKSGTPK